MTFPYREDRLVVEVEPCERLLWSSEQANESFKWLYRKRQQYLGKIRTMKHTNRNIYVLSLMVFAVGCAVARTAKAKQFSTAGFCAVEDSPREVFNFNPGWRCYKGDVTGAEQIDFDDSRWEAADLPHGLEIHGENASGGRNYQGIAWYRKQFTSDANDGRTFLYFEAVMGKAEVWVNGTKVAEHFGGYLPFATDITNHVNDEGRLNIVAVKADNSDSPLYPPGKPQGNLDFTYLGGIYRDTYLIQTGAVHVTLPELSETVAGGGIFVATLDVDENAARMVVCTEVRNTLSKPLQLTVRHTLENAEGNTVLTVEDLVELKGGQSRQLSKQFTAKNVHLWHPDDPYLHFVKTEILSNGRVVDSMRTRIGIRLFEMRGADGFYVNKKFIGKKLVGANRHQDYTYVGNALPNSGQWRDVKLLRKGGCNVIRAAHYPLDPAFYDACDEFGMLVTTANPGWQFFNFDDPVFEQRLYEDTRALVRRDRHVASMFLWETAINETPKQPGHVMNRMHQIAHEEYPFPGLFTVADCDEAEKGGLDTTYHGSNRDIPSFTREYGDGGEVDNFYSQNATTRVKMEWGEKALLEQSLIQARYLSGLYPTWKSRMGGSLWCGIDHQRGYHPDPFWGGLLNGLRIPRYTYYLYQSQYDPDYNVPGIEVGPMLFITHELTQISPADVVIYSNCDEVRLTWLEEVVGTQKPSTKKQWRYLPHPPFVFEDVFDFHVINTDWRRRTHEIEMVAEGLVDGEVVVRVVKPYAEKSVGLQLEVSDEGMALVADGSDFVPVRASVIDRDGAKKVLAREEVYFQVEGPASVIGGIANSGNPARTTSMGVATALIRAGLQPGSIQVTAHCKGLKSASISLESIAPAMTMNYNREYREGSIIPNQDTIVINAPGSSRPEDVKDLQEEVKRLRLEVTEKHQDVMELRSRLDDQ